MFIIGIKSILVTMLTVLIVTLLTSSCIDDDDNDRNSKDGYINLFVALDQIEMNFKKIEKNRRWHNFEKLLVMILLFNEAEVSY